jgi:hypothetical protein
VRNKLAFGTPSFPSPEIHATIRAQATKKRVKSLESHWVQNWKFIEALLNSILDVLILKFAV